MIVDRIRQIIDYKGISERAFCREIGVSNGFLSKASDVGASKVSKIIDKFPEIDAIWLLTGEGEMIRENIAVGGNNNTDSGNISKLLEINSKLVETNARLVEENALLSRKLSELRLRGAGEGDVGCADVG